MIPPWYALPCRPSSAGPSLQRCSDNAFPGTQLGVSFVCFILFSPVSTYSCSPAPSDFPCLCMYRIRMLSHSHIAYWRLGAPWRVGVCPGGPTMHAEPCSATHPAAYPTTKWRHHPRQRLRQRQQRSLPLHRGHGHGIIPYNVIIVDATQRATNRIAVHGDKGNFDKPLASHVMH